MRDEQFESFARAWGQAWELCGRQCSANALNLAFDALAHLELEVVTAALTAHVRDPSCGQFPPKPADIIRQVEGTPEQRASLAWTKLRQAIRRVGPYRSVAFDDPGIHTAVQSMGGWPRVCEWHEDELPFREQDFRRHYASGRQVHPPYLPGIHERQNEAAGFFSAIEAPALIGDPDRAANVIAQGEHQQLVHRADKSVQQLTLDVRRRRPRPPMEDLHKALSGGGDS